MYECELRTADGGRDAEADIARVSARFLDANGEPISFGQIGPVTAADGGSLTELLERSTTGALPIGTRAIEVSVVMTRLVGPDNDDYADNLSFVVTDSSARTPGDVANDGDVDRADVALLARNFGTSGGATFDIGDFNADGFVSLVDLAILQAHFSPGSGGSSIAAVPEPESMPITPRHKRRKNQPRRCPKALGNLPMTQTPNGL